MKHSRRRAVGVIGGIALTGVSGCLNESTDEETGPEVVDVDQEQQTQQHMEYLPARDGEQSHPSYYDGDSPFEADDPEVIISTIDAATRWNQHRWEGYTSRESMTFATDYWETVFPNLSIRVERQETGYEPHPDSDIVIRWREEREAISNQVNPSVYNTSVSDAGDPVAYCDINRVSIQTTDTVNMTVNADAPNGLHRFGLITAIGSAFGIDHSDSGVMNPQHYFLPSRGTTMADAWDNQHREPIVDVLNSMFDALNELTGGEFNSAIETCDETRALIRQVTHELEEFIDNLSEDNSTYAVLAMREVQHILRVDVRAVLEHIEQQAEAENASYRTTDDVPPPKVYAPQWKIGDSVRPSNAIIAGYYDLEIGQSLDLRIGNMHDPDEIQYIQY